MKMNQYIKYILSLVLIFSNLSVAFSMHFCQGEVKEIKLNQLDNQKQNVTNVKKCCSSKKKEKHCELPKKETKTHKDDCCKDISSLDNTKDQHTVKILKLIPVEFLATSVLQVPITVEDTEVNRISKFLIFFVDSNAPPNYIINSQLTFYEG